MVRVLEVDMTESPLPFAQDYHDAHARKGSLHDLGHVIPGKV
jgi:hypothetical protein